jgi:hypothetical protein
MAAKAKDPDRRVIGAERALAGILALLIDERESRTQDDKEAMRTEALLEQAGLSVEDIATATGKKGDTVRKAITRSKAKTRG